MRRTDREITDLNRIRAILDQCKVCHIAMQDKDDLYVIPLSFGYELEDGQLTLCFHCAKEGRKLEILAENPAVAFSITLEGALIPHEDPCRNGCLFASVVGVGTAEFPEAADEACHILSVMFRHQTGREVSFTAQQAEAVCAFRIRVSRFSCKQRS